MRYAILSDLHANENAFRRVLADARQRCVQQVVCLGDVVGYGPLPNETASLARIACQRVIAGNHDDAVSGRIDPRGFNNLAKDAVQRHHAALTPDNLNWLRSLGHSLVGKGFIAAHGDFTDPEKFLYIQDESDAKANFQATDAQLMFVGHTHEPQIFLTGKSGNVYKLAPTNFALEDGKRYIVNPGSVGYPRDHEGTCLSSYVIYDSTLREVTFHFLPFAVSSVMQRGQTPKKLRKGIFLAAFLSIIALIGGAGFLFTPKFFALENEVVRIEKANAKAEKVVEIQANAQRVLTNLTLNVTPPNRHFRANLFLTNNSAKVLLRYRMNDKDGKLVKSAEKSVTTHFWEKINIPKKTTSISFVLLKDNTEDKPIIHKFAPALEP